MNQSDSMGVLAYRLGFLGLIPFMAGPLWLTVAPGSVPQSLDYLWLNYAALIASFMAGTFWGMALLSAPGSARNAALLLSNMLMLSTWFALQLAFIPSMIGIAAVFAALLIAEVWRERALVKLPDYFRLRVLLSTGAIACLGWRAALVLLTS